MKIGLTRNTFIAFFLCAIACLERAEAQGAKLRPVELEVYASIFKQVDPKGLADRELIVGELTSDVAEFKSNEKDPVNGIHKRIPKASRAVIRDFLQIGDQRAQFPNNLAAFGMELPYVIMSESSYLEIFSDESGLAKSWQRFHEVFPRGEGGFVTFSRIGYDAKTGQAMVYVKTACGGLCGSGILYLLVNKSGKWKEVATTLLWIS